MVSIYSLPTWSTQRASQVEKWIHLYVSWAFPGAGCMDAKEVADGNFIGRQIDGRHTCFSKLSFQLVVNKAAKESLGTPGVLCRGSSSPPRFLLARWLGPSMTSIVKKTYAVCLSVSLWLRHSLDASFFQWVTVSDPMAFKPQHLPDGNSLPGTSFLSREMDKQKYEIFQEVWK